MWSSRNMSFIHVILLRWDFFWTKSVITTVTHRNWCHKDLGMKTRLFLLLWQFRIEIKIPDSICGWHCLINVNVLTEKFVKDCTLIYIRKKILTFLNFSKRWKKNHATHIDNETLFTISKIFLFNDIFSYGERRKSITRLKIQFHMLCP